MILGFRRDADEISAFLGYYAARSGNRRFGTTYRSRLQGSRKRYLKMGAIGCPETSLRNYQSALRNIAEDRRSRNKNHPVM